MADRKGSSYTVEVIKLNTEIIRRIFLGTRGKYTLENTLLKNYYLCPPIYFLPSARSVQYTEKFSLSEIGEHGSLPSFLRKHTLYFCVYLYIWLYFYIYICVSPLLSLKFLNPWANVIDICHWTAKYVISPAGSVVIGYQGEARHHVCSGRRQDFLKVP